MVDFAEAVASDVGVDFGRADVRVPKEFLDDTEVGPIFQ